MSLVEGLLLDNLLQSVVVAEYYIALRDDINLDPNRLGQGTAEDPFDGSTVEVSPGTYVYKFDSAMAAIFASGGPKVIRIGPGTFKSRGTSAYYLVSGARVIGSGREVTTIELAASGSNVFGALSTTQLIGVEIAELAIDAARQGGAIYMTGENLLVRSLRVTNFGPNSLVVNRVIVQIADSATGRIAKNCVVDDCIFDNPVAYFAGSSVILLKFAGASQSAPHQFAFVVGRSLMENLFLHLVPHRWYILRRALTWVSVAGLLLKRIICIKLTLASVSRTFQR